MTVAKSLAQFVNRITFEDLSSETIDLLKVRVLDSLACAIGAIPALPIRLIKKQVEEFNLGGSCTLIGGGSSAPDRAAFYNGALIRYLDFNDSYLAKSETCHPSDNLSSVLAAAEFFDIPGRELLAALAVAYQVHCRLSDEAPVRARGFDHTTQGAYAVAAGVSKALGLDVEKTANAIGMAGTANNALRVTRTGSLSHWKALAYPHVAFGVTHTTFLALRGITGPLEVFEGNKGFMETISGKFHIEWDSEQIDRINYTILKRYNAEIHSQSVLEGIIELAELTKLNKKSKLNTDDIDQIQIQIFDVAYHIIGGGQEGDKIHISTKEEADHSLPYLVAVALLDNQVMPAQYSPERITRSDVQQLLRKVKITPSPHYTLRFPLEMPAKINIILKNGQVLETEKKDYLGFHSRPMDWNTVKTKFRTLTDLSISKKVQDDIIQVTQNLENIQTRELTRLLERVAEVTYVPAYRSVG